MDTFDAIATKLESREYSQKPVPADVKKKVLEAARLTASGMNYQEWKLILVQEPARLRKLAEDSTTGQWVASVNFAVMVLMDQKYNFGMLDAGRVVQDMQLAAWNYGVSSRVFTGFNKELMQKDFGFPQGLGLTVVVGFGYPAKKVLGKKNRLPLNEVAFEDRYGQRLKF
jgi:nitroreductase